MLMKGQLSLVLWIGLFRGLLVHAQTPDDLLVVANGVRQGGFTFGTYKSDLPWKIIQDETEALTIEYPGDPTDAVGVAFLETEKDQPPRDVSDYSALVIEMSGAPSQTIAVGIK